MDKKSQQKEKEMKALVTKILESKKISYDEWLMARHMEVISEHSGDILTALNLINDRN